MARQADVAAYWPPVVGETREFRLLAGAESPELTAAWENVETVLENQFLSTAGRYGIERLESIMGLVPQAGDNLEARRQRIWLQMNQRLPYTLPMLRVRLDELLGEGNYRLELLPEAYTVSVTLSTGQQGQYQYLEELLGRMLPANMLWRRHMEQEPAVAAVSVGAVEHRHIRQVVPIDE